MTSELKSATARANGAKSRGPKTPETRAISAKNSLKHGLTARETLVLECEDPDEFHRMAADFAQTFQPATAAEQMLVDEMLDARWRLNRIMMIETSLLDDEVRRQLPVIAQKPNRGDPGVQLASAFRSLADGSRSLSLASKYESRFHRVYHRAYQTLRELQHARKSTPPEPVAPSVSAGAPSPASSVKSLLSPQARLTLCVPPKNSQTNQPPADFSEPRQSWSGATTQEPADPQLPKGDQT